MDLLWIVFWVAVIGGIVWAITTYIPMHQILKTVIWIATAIVLGGFVLRQLGAHIPNVLH